MRQDEAEKLAQTVKLSAGYDLDGRVGELCDYILSGDHKREIENAAFERAAQLIERDKKVQGLARVHLAIKVRSLIQPPAQKEDGE